MSLYSLKPLLVAPINTPVSLTECPSLLFLFVRYILNLICMNLLYTGSRNYRFTIFQYLVPSLQQISYIGPSPYSSSFFANPTITLQL